MDEGEVTPSDPLKLTYSDPYSSFNVWLNPKHSFKQALINDPIFFPSSLISPYLQSIQPSNVRTREKLYACYEFLLF